ncbi:MAG: aminoacyl-histidine dipeptidase [Gammaproteobacteria bacterium]|nr:aminoacyl-histidine dipeptidase [Gammaproteobacteria bacterium]MBU1480039.1 aminoacyl-histidine dipeptidase [Gammaproteobacteria bacterium]
MTSSNNLNELQPRSVWAHFATLCAIPRSSQHEAALREHLIGWAQARGIVTVVDDAGNLILKKAASPGCEAMPGVILQGHLDMVCQANAGTQHDFEKGAIHTVVRDGWVVAENTTLGADNGIGVALALAALEEPDLIRPPLEVLLTVNEESGMDGARGLAPGTLQGTTLINLDTEEWGHFYLGCAGGVDVEVRHDCEMEALPPDFAILRFDVSGLRGGHSGIDIHLGRGNAIKLLAEALRDLSGHTDVRLIAMNGGSARNAIPREAFAVCALPVAAVAGIDEWAEHRLAAWRQRFAEADANVLFKYELDEMPVGKAIQRGERDRLLAFLDIIANGVSRMSDDFSGVVDTSANLGVVSLAQGVFRATFKVRSLHDGRADVLADKMVSHAESYSLHAWKDGAYPGWTPNPSSKLLAQCQQVYTAQFGQPASLQVIHAGLECGLLAASHPHLDMISFGPDIRGAHAPGERVAIESVARCWQLLKAVLQALAAR